MWICDSRKLCYLGRSFRFCDLILCCPLDGNGRRTNIMLGRRVSRLALRKFDRNCCACGCDRLNVQRSRIPVPSGEKKELRAADERYSSQKCAKRPEKAVF